MTLGEVGGKKNPRRLDYPTFKVILKDTSQACVLNFSFEFLIFFFNAAKFTLKSLNIWSSSCRCSPGAQPHAGLQAWMGLRAGCRESCLVAVNWFGPSGPETEFCQMCPRLREVISFPLSLLCPGDVPSSVHPPAPGPGPPTCTQHPGCLGKPHHVLFEMDGLNDGTILHLSSEEQHLQKFKCWEES